MRVIMSTSSDLMARTPLPLCGAISELQGLITESLYFQIRVWATNVTEAITWGRERVVTDPRWSGKSL